VRLGYESQRQKGRPNKTKHKKKKKEHLSNKKMPQEKRRLFQHRLAG